MKKGAHTGCPHECMRSLASHDVTHGETHPKVAELASLRRTGESTTTQDIKCHDLASSGMSRGHSTPSNISHCNIMYYGQLQDNIG